MFWVDGLSASRNLHVWWTHVWLAQLSKQRTEKLGSRHTLSRLNKRVPIRKTHSEADNWKKRRASLNKAVNQGHGIQKLQGTNQELHHESGTKRQYPRRDDRTGRHRNSRARQNGQTDKEKTRTYLPHREWFDNWWDTAEHRKMVGKQTMGGSGKWNWELQNKNRNNWTRNSNRDTHGQRVTSFFASPWGIYIANSYLLLQELMETKTKLT